MSIRTPSISTTRLHDSINRFLQNNNNNNGNGNGGSSGSNEANLLFFGLILLLFVISFACYPLCYRRRRRNVNVNTTTASPLSRPTTHDASRQQQQPPPPVKQVDFEKRLAPTTITVTSNDLIRRDNSQHITGSILSMPLSTTKEDKNNKNNSTTYTNGDNNNRDSVMFDIELGNDVSTALSDAFAENTVLQLPKDKPNGGRLVPSTCAICLSNYKPNDQVSWSSNPQCQHAFHTDCMVRYAESATLKKRQEGKDAPVACPLCRNSFISEEGKGHIHTV